jgi:hypothetical protein
MLSIGILDQPGAVEALAVFAGTAELIGSAHRLGSGCDDGIGESRRWRLELVKGCGLAAGSYAARNRLRPRGRWSGGRRAAAKINRQPEGELGTIASAHRQLPPATFRPHR